MLFPTIVFATVAVAAKVYPASQFSNAANVPRSAFECGNMLLENLVLTSVTAGSKCSIPDIAPLGIRLPTSSIFDTPSTILATPQPSIAPTPSRCSVLDMPSLRKASAYPVSSFLDTPVPGHIQRPSSTFNPLKCFISDMRPLGNGFPISSVFDAPASMTIVTREQTDASRILLKLVALFRSMIIQMRKRLTVPYTPKTSPFSNTTMSVGSKQCKLAKRSLPQSAFVPKMCSAGTGSECCGKSLDIQLRSKVCMVPPTISGY